MRPWTDRKTDTQTRVTTIHFALSTTQAKCNNYEIFIIFEHISVYADHTIDKQTLSDD